MPPGRERERGGSSARRFPGHGYDGTGGLAAELTSVVGPEHVHTDTDRRVSFEVDRMGRYLGRCLLAVESASTAELAAELAACRHTGVAGAAPGALVVLFGHAGDGGVHVNVAVGPGSGPVERIAAVFGLVGELDGSVSAEHGIGVDKVRRLGLTRSPEEIGVMRRIKEALDPDGVLNPGVLVG